MKKVFLILMLGVFTLSLSSFKVSNLIPEVNCNNVAAAAWQEARDEGASNRQATIIFRATYFACEESKEVQLAP